MYFCIELESLIRTGFLCVSSRWRTSVSWLNTTPLVVSHSSTTTTWHPSMDECLCGSCGIRHHMLRGLEGVSPYWIMDIQTSVLVVHPTVACELASALLDLGALEKHCLRQLPTDERAFVDPSVQWSCSSTPLWGKGLDTLGG